MSDAWHDIQKMTEWSKRYPYRVKCLDCGCMLASEDKEDGYCYRCYNKRFSLKKVSIEENTIYIKMKK